VLLRVVHVVQHVVQACNLPSIKISIVSTAGTTTLHVIVSVFLNVVEEEEVEEEEVEEVEEGEEVEEEEEEEEELVAAFVGCGGV